MKNRFKVKDEIMSLDEYLTKAADDPSMYATAAERMLTAIGEPEIIDTSKEPRLGRVFENRLLKRYKTFDDFYGLESVIEKVVDYFKHAAQGLEEKRQILYFLGPVGGGKSSIAERLKTLMEKEPFYALCVKTEEGKAEISPIFDNPLGLFKPEDATTLGIPARALTGRVSPWALKRIEEFDGDISKFNVIKLYPNQAKQIAISKTEPGDDNTQDISSLVGKIDIRKLEYYSQDDPDAYRYNGGLCLGNRGILEFVEMFKAPIKILHPLLTATQEGNFKGTEALPPIPFEGMVIAHSNEAEWETFRNNKNNEAFIDRVCIIKVPYNLRVTEEEKIYEKLINQSSIADAPLAPHTLHMLAEFSVLSSLELAEGEDMIVKMKVYNGDDIKKQYASAKSLFEYKDLASSNEGFFGLSTRSAYKILSKVYNFDSEELGANPVHLLHILKTYVKEEDISEDLRDYWNSIISERLEKDYIDKIRKDIQSAFLESASEYGQHVFEKYLSYADYWIQDQDYRDPETGQIYNKHSLNDFLEEVEKPAGINNPKEFRYEIVQFVLRYKATHGGKSPSWLGYERIKDVIEQKIFAKTEDFLPQLTFTNIKDEEAQRRTNNFLKNMMDKGYTQRQTRLITEWFKKVTQANK